VGHLNLALDNAVAVVVAVVALPRCHFGAQQVRQVLPGLAADYQILQD